MSMPPQAVSARRLPVAGGARIGAGPVRRRAVLSAAGTLWWREVVRFVRQRATVINAFAQPLVFWLLLGGGFSSSFRAPDMPADTTYLTYFYPGIIVLALLFTAIFATIAVVEDRQGGFLQGVLVAPLSRATIVLGQSLGCTTLALFEGALFLLLAPFGGVHLSATAVVTVLFVQFLLAFGLANLGLIIAWRMDSTRGFHAVMNLILIPIWLLSGAVFPASGNTVFARVMGWIMYFNPLTYGMAALRRCLNFGHPEAIGAVPPLLLSLVVMSVFCAVTFWFAALTARRATA